MQSAVQGIESSRRTELKVVGARQFYWVSGDDGFFYRQSEAKHQQWG